MNKNLVLALNYFKEQQALHQHSRLLNLSRELIPFPATETRQYLRSFSPILPFDNQSFHFVYSNEPTVNKLFETPLQMVNEFTRVSALGGWLETASPVNALVFDTSPVLNDGRYRYLSWTDMHTNTLCLMPYAGLPSTDLLRKEGWVNLVSFNPMYLKNFFTWTHPLDIHFRMYTYDTQKQYDLLFEQAVRQAAQHTQFLLENYPSQ